MQYQIPQYNLYNPYYAPSPAPSSQQVGTQQLNKRPPTAHGPQSALQYPMGPNEISNAIFEETDDCTFYMVTTDGMGTKTIEEYEYHRKQPVQSPPPVSQGDFDELDRRVARIEEVLNGIHGQDKAAADATTAQPE